MALQVRTHRARWILILLAVAAFCTAFYLLLSRYDRPKEPLPELGQTGMFPELQPELAAPVGYKWAFRDGPDFYTWLLAEPAEVGTLAKSGVGVYVGHHPNTSKTTRTEDRIAGRVCGQDVSWQVKHSDAKGEAWVRRDVVLGYEHGNGYMPVRLHVWVWGPSEKVVAALASELAELKFNTRPR